MRISRKILIAISAFLVSFLIRFPKIYNLVDLYNPSPYFDVILAIFNTYFLWKKVIRACVRGAVKLRMAI